MTEIGMLAELNLHPGDVVEYVGEPERGWEGGARYTMTSGEDGGFTYEGQLTHCMLRGSAPFRIISRATPAQKLWRDMTPEEKGALLLAHHEGENIKWVTFGEEKSSKDGYIPVWSDNVAYWVDPSRTKSEWSAWFTSKEDGTTKLDLDTCAEVERVALGDGKQFAYRVKKWVE